ncbi:hypothetical protein AGMMS50268_21190 [Spirochaetia bacterium]|nr:hypothetical protein AGMMS50268_21190 [Spirochaetia bacterium]
MPQFIYDALNSFGKLSGPLASGSFPNIINLADAKADRMTVDVIADNTVAGGTSIKVTVQGCATEAGTYVDVGQNTFTLAQLKAGNTRVAISPNPYQYLKVTITATGTFTGGGAEALINSYLGK